MFIFNPVIYKFYINYLKILIESIFYDFSSYSCIGSLSLLFYQNTDNEVNIIG